MSRKRFSDPDALEMTQAEYLRSEYGDDLDDWDGEAWESQARSAETPDEKFDDNYPNGWEQISRQYRSSVGWRCECCGVDLAGRRDLLHAHHITGTKANSSSDNLMALCFLCHAKQPGHRHLLKELSVSDEQFILDARKENRRGTEE